MTPKLRRLALPLALVALSGCLTHIAPKEDTGSRGIRWREDFDAARRDAASVGRPLLLVMVAGPLKDKC
jgi:hypothetical protein